jgi:hypothetical protein
MSACAAAAQAAHTSGCLPGGEGHMRSSVSGALVSVMSGALEGSLTHQVILFAPKPHLNLRSKASRRCACCAAGHTDVIHHLTCMPTNCVGPTSKTGLRLHAAFGFPQCKHCLLAATKQ